MSTGIPNVTVHSDNTQHGQAHAHANSGGNATANNHVVNNGTLHTIVSFAGGVLAALGGLFAMMKFNGEVSDDSHEYTQVDGNWQNSKGEIYK